jgi:flagellar motor switch protein FliG
MGNRGAWLIKEDMKYLGNLPREEVEQAQNIIIAVAAKLEDAGEIVIPRQD